MSWKTHFYTLVLIALFACKQADGEEIIPEYPAASHYAAEWSNSAFHREVVPPTPVRRIEADFSRDLVLEGLVEDEGDGYIAFVKNRKDNSYFTVTNKRQAGVPYRLISATQTRDPATSSVRITNGTETATIRFKAASLTQAIETPTLLAPSNAETPVESTDGHPADVAPPRRRSITGQSAPPQVDETSPSEDKETEVETDR